MKTQNLMIALLFVLSPLAAMPTQAQSYGDGESLDPSPLIGAGGPLAAAECGVSGDPVWDALCNAVFTVFAGQNPAFYGPTGSDARNVDGDGHFDDDQDGRKDLVRIPTGASSPAPTGVYIQLDYFFDRQGTAGDTQFYNPAIGGDVDYGLQPMVYQPNNAASPADHDQVRLASELVRDDFTFSPAIYDGRDEFCYLCVHAESATFIVATYPGMSSDGAQIGTIRYETLFDFDLEDDSIEERQSVPDGWQRGPAQANSILKMDSGFIYEDGKRWNDGHYTVVFGEKHIKDAGLLSASQQDMDDDGWTDYQEFECNSNPTRWQSTCDDWDGDGVSNDVELADPNRDPFQDDDFDKDGVFNPVDNCPTTPNGDQADFDGDGLGDLCDNDWDGDGSLNGVDAFPRCDQGTADLDNDGLPNVRLAGNGVCDEALYPGGLVEDLDDDGDGVLDVDDNCPTVDNAGQLNTDMILAGAGNRHVTADALGDACDTDIDGDGVTNANEATDGTNPLLPDTDGDGLSDKQERDDNTQRATASGIRIAPDDNADPKVADTDEDGLTDCQERFHKDRAQCEDPTFTGPFDGGYGTDANTADTDGDGFSDKDEVDAGTNPNDPLSPGPSLVTVPNPVDVLFNPECDYVEKGGEGYNEEACGAINVDAPETFLDDSDVYDTDGDGDFNEPNGQLDQIEGSFFFFVDGSAHEGGQTPYTQRFQGDDTFTLVYFEDPLGPAGSPHRDTMIVSIGDARDTGATELLVIETQYEARLAGRGATANGFTYGFSEVWCIVDEGGTPVLYTGTQRFNEAGADHPCGQPYSWTDSSNEINDAWTDGWYAADSSLVTFVDDDRNQVPEKLILRLPDFLSTPDGCASAGFLGDCEVLVIEQDLEGVPNPDDLCGGDGSFPTCVVGNPAEDTDGDDVPDAVDECPDEQGPPEEGGCPTGPVDPEGDDDGDGVPNGEDQCAGTPPGAPVDEDGCEAVPDPSEGDPTGLAGCLDEDAETACAIEDLPAGVPECSEDPGAPVCTGPEERTTLLQQLIGPEWPGLQIQIPGLPRIWV